MYTSTLIHNYSAEKLDTKFESLQNQFNELRQKFELKVPTEYLTRQEVAEMLKCDLSTIHNWTKKGKLTPYGLGNRVYFKRSEIELALKPLKK